MTAHESLRVVLHTILIVTVLSVPSKAFARQVSGRRPPNIVIIFTDDQGYSDVGVFGARGFKTPNLDRMAAQGMKFTSFYVAQPVCSASRAALLTGCYPNRIGIAGALGPRAKHGLNPNEVTIAEICKSDDATSACFDGAVLEEALTLLGAPVVKMDVASDQENAFVCIRLNEVSPSGESLQISYGILNLTHRNSHELPEVLEPGRRYSVRVQLNDIAHTFAPGNRIRIAISTAFWPIVWPSPHPVTVSLFTGVSTLCLPVREPRSSDAEVRPLTPPRHSRVHPTSILVDAEPEFVGFKVDMNTSIQSFIFRADSGTKRFDRHGWTTSAKTDYQYHIHPDDPTSACVDLTATETYGREGQLDARIEARQKMTCDETHFIIEAKLDVFDGEKQLHSRQWNKRIARDCV